MTRNAFSFAGVAGLFIAVALLAGCYAPLVNQNGNLNFDLKVGDRAILNGNSQAIVLIVNSDSEASLKEILYLIGKSKTGLSGSEKDRLTTLAKEMATSGLVKIGGYPFYLTTLNGSDTSGSFQIPGIPGGRDYFVKLFVLNSTVSSFTAKDVDENFWQLIQYVNWIFDNEGSYVSDYAAWQDWQNWQPTTGQLVSVKGGESASVTMNLSALP